MTSKQKTVPVIKDSAHHFLIQTIDNPVEYRSKLFNEYGDIAYCKLDRKRKHYVLKNPVMAEHILFKNQDNYIKHPKILDLVAPFIGDKSILMTNDMHQYHHDKPILTTAFNREVYFEGYATTMVKNIAAILDEMLVDAEEPKLVSFYQMLGRIAQKNITETLFTDLDADYKDVVSVVYDQLRMVNITQRPQYKFLLNLPTKFRRQYWDISRKKYKIINHMLESRKKSSKNYDDLLSALIKNIDDVMTKDIVIQHIAMLFSTGQITTTSATYWTLIFLSLYPSVAQEVRSELDSVLGDRLPTYDDLSKLVYTKAVLLESMRIRPPIFSPVARQSIEDDEILGCPIQGGQGISLSFYHIHHNEEFWHNPEGFDPQRFIDHPWGQSYQYANMTFGAGRRGCMGKHFAIMHATLQIVTILQKCNVYLPENTKPTVEPLVAGVGRPSNDKMWVEKRKL